MLLLICETGFSDRFSFIVLFVSFAILALALRILFFVPESRRQEQHEIELKRKKAESLMFEAEKSLKAAEDKWSLRAAEIKFKISQEFDKKVLDAIRLKEEQIEIREQKVKQEWSEIRNFISTAKKSSPAWIAQAITDYEYLRYDTEYRKSVFSTVSKYISSLRAINREKRLEMYSSRYKCLYYESLFPGIIDAIENTAWQRKTQEDVNWLSDSEYALLSDADKNQLALDRYMASQNKSKWQIGRDYELFIGHCYRRKGFSVEQVGMEKKLEDMGRDLVCRSNPLAPVAMTCIVQCKYWSKEKRIHENHITQLFGTTVEFAMEKGLKINDGKLPSCLRPVLITSTELSDTARRFAEALGVEYHEHIDFPKDPNSYPRIKCNKSSGIYHLPFDEQYDVTKIIPSQGDCFVFTVAEAEKMGFVHAKRHFASIS